MASLLEDPTQTIPEQFRNISLTEEQRGLIKASAAPLASHGLDITKSFYETTVAEYPSLKNIFNLTHQSTNIQAQALANTVYAYAVNIDDLTPLMPAVKLINNKHASLYVRPEHYGVVGDQLLKAIERILGAAVTPELLAAWAAAYWQLAKFMMLQEQELYKTNPTFSDWQDFRIAKKEKESDDITDFYLEPVDNKLKPLPTYNAGQYISIKVDVPELGCSQPRQYSISDKPNQDSYRISIKKDAGAKGCPMGVVSNLMHSKSVGDVISVSAPRGTFFTADTLDPESPLVLISAGIGITSLHSVLSSLAGLSATRPFTWIHSAHDTKSRVFLSSLLDLAKKQENMQVVYFNSTVSDTDVEGVDYHFKGRLDLAKLDREKQLYLNSAKTQFYICAPSDFMIDLKDKLKAQGVSDGQIHSKLYTVAG